MRTIALATDFGTADPYAGIMKGVILSICPETAIVDICYGIKFADIRTAAFYLEVSHKYFPPDTIFVTVVDPGVGGARRGIGARIEKATFIAPDNGCLSRIFTLFPRAEIRELTNRSLMLETISSTFHGRDIFAPVAAYLAKGVNFSEVGRTISDPVTFQIDKFEAVGNTIRTQVIHIDNFGNIITNIENDFQDIRLKNGLIQSSAGDNPLTAGETFESIPTGKLGMIPGSSGYLEIVLNRGSAAATIGAEVGDSFIIELSGEDK